jgi:hypothetical protein
MARKRDYAHEYSTYQGTPEQLHNQSLRHQARRAYIKAHPGVDIKGKDINHIEALDKGGNPLRLTNLNVETKRTNRGWRGRPDPKGPKYGK